MKIQYVSKYIALSKEGLVPEMLCPEDQGPLFSNMDLEDSIYLYCLECNYRKIIGLSHYDKIVAAVKEHSND